MLYAGTKKKDVGHATKYRVRTIRQGRRNRENMLAIPPLPPLCVEMGFTRTFPRNQDETLKLKSKLIFYQILVVF